MPLLDDYTDEQILALAGRLGRAEAARSVGVSVRTYDRKLAEIRAKTGAEWRSRSALRQIPPRVVDVPDPEIPIEDLIARRRADGRRRIAGAVDERVVKLQEDGPFGLLFMGDLHLDALGCNMDRVVADTELVQRTEHLHAIVLGDLINNWPRGGRMAALWADQDVSALQSFRLAEHFLKAIDPLAVILGNHDLFDASLGCSVVEWMLRPTTGIAQRHEAKIRFDFGEESFRVWARHDFPGSSMWSRSHGQSRAALRAGYPADLLISGHRHTYETRHAVRDNGSLFHAIQVGSYSEVDDYAVKNGFPLSPPVPSVLAIVRPGAPSFDRTQVWTDVQAGADYLGWLRRSA